MKMCNSAYPSQVGLLNIQKPSRPIRSRLGSLKADYENDVRFQVCTDVKTGFILVFFFLDYQADSSPLKKNVLWWLSIYLLIS